MPNLDEETGEGHKMTIVAMIVGSMLAFAASTFLYFAGSVDLVHALMVYMMMSSLTTIAAVSRGPMIFPDRHF